MMAAPPQYIDGGGLPSMSMFKDSKRDPFRPSVFSSRHAQPSPAMSIPGTHDRDDVPPPLPPPRFLPSFQNDPNPFAAGFSPRDDRPDYLRRNKPEHDEGYASFSTGSTRYVVDAMTTCLPPPAAFESSKKTLPRTWAAQLLTLASQIFSRTPLSLRVRSQPHAVLLLHRGL